MHLFRSRSLPSGADAGHGRTAARRRVAARLLAALALVVMLGGCTVYVVEGEPSTRGTISLSFNLDQVITQFQPVRGAGATYLVGERVSFAVRTRESGYVTLTALDPDGSVYTLARNIFVRAGQTRVIPGEDSRVEFVANPPTGRHRVRATFTSERTDQNRVRYEGRTGEEGWTSAIRVELQDDEIRDVAETYLFVERRR